MSLEKIRTRIDWYRSVPLNRAFALASDDLVLLGSSSEFEAIRSYNRKLWMLGRLKGATYPPDC
jgi:hypothetical protein